jgi:hypothetical protein
MSRIDFIAGGECCIAALCLGGSAAKMGVHKGEGWQECCDQRLVK